MEKKKHPGKIIGLIAGGVVLLIVIIVIAASFMGGSDDMQGSSLDQETINKVREFPMRKESLIIRHLQDFTVTRTGNLLSLMLVRIL